MLMLTQQCTEHFFSRFDTDGSTTVGVYFEDGTWDQNRGKDGW